MTSHAGSQEHDAGSTVPPPVIVIAASIGGPAAIQSILASFPPDLGAVTILLQHRAQLPGTAWLQLIRKTSPLSVREIEPGMVMTPGVVYLAPSTRHVEISRDRCFLLRDGRRIRGLLASANPLLESAAETLGPSVIAVVLTGSGLDATDGVQAVHRNGGYVIVQNRQTSKNFGMPGSALATGVVDEMLPLDQIGPRILARIRAMGSALAT